MPGWNHTSLCWRVPSLESRSSTTWWKKSLNCWVVWRRSWNIWMIEAGTQTKNKNPDFLKVFFFGGGILEDCLVSNNERIRSWLIVGHVFFFCCCCCCCCCWLDILFWRQEPYGFGCLVRVWMLDISWMYAIMGLQSFCIQQTGPDVFFCWWNLVMLCSCGFVDRFSRSKARVDTGFFWGGYYRIELKKDRFV